MMSKFLYGLTLVLTVLTVGCSSNLESNNSNDGTSLTTENGEGSGNNGTPEIVNQAPSIACDFKNTSTNQVRSINTIDGADTFFADFPRENDSIALDCTDSSDNESDNSKLTFLLSTNYTGAGSSFTQISETDLLNLSAVGVGRHHMALKIIDEDGNETIKDFRLTVRCEDPSTPTLDISGVTATAGAKLNYFTYAIDPSKVGNVGGQAFQVAFDFNGDGDYDPADASKQNDEWGAVGEYSFPDVYTIFATENHPTRTIGVRLRNACQEEAAFEVPLAFVMPNIPRNPTSLAVPKPYYYLQADIVGDNLSNIFSHQRVNGEYLATWYSGDPKRVECDYKVSNGKGSFTISGFNNYQTYSYGRHGMSIKLDNIDDPKTNGTIVRTHLDGVTMSSANYNVTSIGDAVVERNFAKIGNCTQRISVTHAIAVTPCASGPAAESDTVTLLGEFQCPVLRSGSDEVEAKHGKFFCEVATVDRCVGGGGGGGGGVPPPEQ